MNLLKELTSKKHEAVVMMLMALYVIFPIETPMALAKVIDTEMGKVVVYVAALSMFAHSLEFGVLSLLVAYTIVKRSSVMTGSNYMKESEKAEEIKMEILEKYNAFPKTLEEQVVENMAPLVIHDAAPNVDYKPVLSKLNDAAPINYDGVI
tara:strand:- start:90 stop:542 length:453 start_codon:yes stop_codon:yes gene_type:complete